ncbi:hypothetical protein D3C73_1226550 [compost metagenome]
MLEHLIVAAELNDDRSLKFPGPPAQIFFDRLRGKSRVHDSLHAFNSSRTIIEAPSSHQLLCLLLTEQLQIFNKLSGLVQHAVDHFLKVADQPLHRSFVKQIHVVIQFAVQQALRTKKYIELYVKRCRIYRKLDRLERKLPDAHPVRARHSVLVMKNEHRVIYRISRAVRGLASKINQPFKGNVLMLVAACHRLFHRLGILL